MMFFNDVALVGGTVLHALDHDVQGVELELYVVTHDTT